MTYVLYRAINVNRFPMSVFTIIVDSKASAELRVINLGHCTDVAEPW